MIYIPITSAKIEMLEAATAAYRATGQLMLALVDGRLFVPGQGDDIGLYYFVPLIATRLGVSAATALSIFQWTILVLATLVGSLVSLKLVSGRESRVFAVMGMLGVATLSFGIGDAYLVGSMFTAAVIPSALYAFARKDENRTLLALAVIGFFAAIANFISFYSACGGLAFVLALIYWSGETRKAKLWFVAALAAGFLAATAITQVSISRRDDFLRATNSAYEAPSRNHGFWLKTYMGLGFLANPYVSGFRNDVAAARLEELSPGTRLESPTAGRVLRRETLTVMRNHPWFAIRTLAAKAGVVFVYLFVFVAAGLLTRPPRGNRENNGKIFAVGGLFSIVPGLMWIPSVEYLSSAIALAVIYATYTIARARD